MGGERERGEGREERPQAKYSQNPWIQQCLTGLLHPGLLGGGVLRSFNTFFYLQILANKRVNAHWLHSYLIKVAKLFPHF